MIDGLKLTITGDELCKRLDDRINHHQRRAAWYKAKREPDVDDKYELGLPEKICAYEEQFHGWRATVLAYIRDHIDGGEVYRLGSSELALGEILPERPAMVAQEQYRRDHCIGISLECIAQESFSFGFGSSAIAEALAEQRHTTEHSRNQDADRTRRTRSRTAKR